MWPLGTRIYHRSSNVTGTIIGSTGEDLYQIRWDDAQKTRLQAFIAMNWNRQATSLASRTFRKTALSEISIVDTLSLLGHPGV